MDNSYVANNLKLNLTNLENNPTEPLRENNSTEPLRENKSDNFVVASRAFEGSVRVKERILLRELNKKWGFICDFRFNNSADIF